MSGMYVRFGGVHVEFSSKHLRLPAAALILLLFVFHIEAIIEGIRSALVVCAVSIVPSLFLFLVLSDLIVSALLSDGGKITSPKYTAFLLGALCGFPTGAVVCERLCQSGVLDPKDAEHLLPLCNSVSPAFAIGAIGVSMLGDMRLGILLYGSQLLASLLLLLPLRVPVHNGKATAQSFSFSEMFFAAVEKSIGSIMRICALICLFSALLSILRVYCGETAYTLLAALLEIGSGSNAAAALYTTAPKLSLALCAFACGWSGICVHFQIFSVLKSIKINTFKFVLYKGLLGLLSTAFTTIGYKLFFCP